MQPTAEKIQPWKAGWVARNSQGDAKARPGGISHGFAKGKAVVLGGFTSGIAIQVKADEDRLANKQAS